MVETMKDIMFIEGFKWDVLRYKTLFVEVTDLRCWVKLLI